MKLSKRITTIALAMIMILSTSSVFAADYDLKISETGESKSFLDWIFDDAVFLDVMYSEGKYLVECGGKYYKAEDVIEKSTANPNAELDELVKDLEPVAEEPDELKVVSVSAITDQVLAQGDAEGELKFLVNGKEELTATEFDEKYGEEGYKVAYKYNFTGDLNDRPVGTFKYAVEVTDADGNVIPEGGVVAADFVDFKLVDATKAVSIEKVVLGNERDYLTTDEGNVGFKVTEAKNALGEDLDEDSLIALSGELEKVVSDDVTVAYVDGTTITARKAGSVTFELTYYEGDDAITVNLPVEVKEAGVATRVEAENQKVAAGTDVNDLDFKVFDQHDLEISSGYDVKVKDVDGKDADLSKKGIYTVEIIPADKEDAIGSFTVTVVDVEEAEYSEIFFEDIKVNDKEVVLNIEKVNGDYKVPSKDLNLKGIKEDLEVAADDLTIVTSGDGYYLESSDEEVFTVNYNAGKVTVTLADGLEKATKATVKLTHKQGDLVQELAEIELEVVNTTPQIDNLTLAEGVKKLAVKESDKATGWDVDDITQLRSTDVKDEDGKVTALKEDMIAKVEFSANDGKAIVTIADIYGGKEFVFDAAVLVDIQVAGNGFVNSSGYKGVFVEISLPGNDNDKIQSLKVELFNEAGELIVTNTLNNATSAHGAGLTSPFVAIPEEDGYSSKSWTTTWVGEASIDNAPSYAVITAVDTNGLSYSSEEVEYTGDWSPIWNIIEANGLVYSPDGLILLDASGWNQGTDTILAEDFRDGVTEIGFRAFDSLQVKTVVFPESVKIIGDAAFGGNLDIENVTFPSQLEKIGTSSFEGCNNLNSVSIPSTVTYIGNNAFKKCKIMDLLGDLPSGLTYLGSDVFQETAITSITIPNGITEIKEDTFYACESLSSISFEGNITSIGNNGIRQTAITNLEIPGSLTSIGDMGLRDNKNLTTIEFGGTMEEWNDVTKGLSYNLFVPATEIICTDGVATF